MTLLGLYVLNERGDPVPAPSLEAWAEFMQYDERRVVRRQQWIDSSGVECMCSTVFLGIDHGFGHDLPVLWETMLFRNGRGVGQERYTSRAAAIAGHNELVAAFGGPVLE